VGKRLATDEVITNTVIRRNVELLLENTQHELIRQQNISEKFRTFSWKSKHGNPNIRNKRTTTTCIQVSISSSSENKIKRQTMQDSVLIHLEAFFWFTYGAK